jgi:hypothetical protein
MTDTDTDTDTQLQETPNQEEQVTPNQQGEGTPNQQGEGTQNQQGEGQDQQDEGVIKKKSYNESMDKVDTYIEQQKNKVEETWCKLNKTIKLQKIKEYVARIEVDKTKNSVMLEFLRDCLDKKKLLRVKDVVFDKTTGTIQNIPSLIYTNGRYTLKNMDTKHVSTMKSLPKKKTTLSNK